MQHYDVGIIGAGLAGLIAARQLGAAGLRVLLVDRKPAVGVQIHTTGIFVRKTFEDFALPRHLLGPPIRHVRLYSPAGRCLSLTSQHDEFRLGAMAEIYEHLLRGAVATGYVRWLPSTRYCGASLHGEGLRVSLETAGELRNATVRYLIGADGASSRVAADLALDRNDEWIIGVEDVYEAGPSDRSPTVNCILDPKIAPGYIAWVVDDGREIHLGVGGYAGRFQPVEALAALHERMAGQFDLSVARKLERRGGKIPVNGILRRIGNRHGLLLGDAAGAVSPLTAGGFDGCLRLSTFASRLIIHYLRTGDASALAEYDGRKFRTRFISRLWMRRMLASIASRSLVEAGFSLLSTPLLRPLVEHVFFGRGSFPEPVSRNRSTVIQRG